MAPVVWTYPYVTSFRLPSFELLAFRRRKSFPPKDILTWSMCGVLIGSDITFRNGVIIRFFIVVRAGIRLE